MSVQYPIEEVHSILETDQFKAPAKRRKLIDIFVRGVENFDSYAKIFKSMLTNSTNLFRMIDFEKIDEILIGDSM